MRTREGVTRSFLVPDESTGPWIVDISLGPINGRIECTGMSIRLTDGSNLPLTTAVLRSVNLGSLVDRARDNADRELINLVIPPDRRPPFGNSLGALRNVGLGPLAVQRKKAPGRPPLSHEKVEQAAAIYLATPRKPTRTVAEKLDVSYSTASDYVARARKAGLIDPTTRGRTSGRSARD